jgi:phosphoglycerate dehydrogenase-like enzyme
VYRPAVVVFLGSAAEPPGIEKAEEWADLEFARGVPELAAALPGADGLFAWDFDGPALAAAWPVSTRLGWLQWSAVGVDTLCFPALAQSRVVVTNASGIFEEPMAESVLGYVLAFAKDLPATLAHQQSHGWDHRETERIAGKKMLVAGVGPVGRAIAKMAARAGMQVAGLGRTPRPGFGSFARVAGIEDLHREVGEADYVVDALPLTPSTHYVFDAAAFASMQPSARFINVGRGGTVDERALIDALRRGVIGGAALDVFTREPLPAESPLWDMPNVIVSAHMSADVAGYRSEMVGIFLDNLQRFVGGRPLRNVVDITLGFAPSQG